MTYCFYDLSAVQRQIVIPIRNVAVLKLKARASLATEIAMVDRMRFNEAVANNFYPCAPSTVRGSMRYFDVNDIVVLRSYGRLLEEGMTPRGAGRLVCGMRNLLEQHPEADRVLCVSTSMGSGRWLLADEFDRSATIMSGSDIVSVREWYLGYTRARIVHALEEENNVVGDRDEDGN